MKILLEQKGGHLVMSVDHHEASKTVGEFDGTVDDMIAELKDRHGVKRMAYHIWHWDLRLKQEAEEYITYFALKHQ